MYAIVIMAREPTPGKVKTRLVPPLDPETAAKLYRSFLLDKVEQVAFIRGCDHFVAYTPDRAKSYFKQLVPNDFRLVAQKGNDLGERLDNITEYIFKKNYKKVILTDSDSPNLPIGFINEGLKQLDISDIVLGPTDDGGYYLIGMKTPTPEVFTDIPWSTSEVTTVTIEKAKKIGKKINVINEWYDIDTFKDLKRLKKELRSNYNKNEITQFHRNTLRRINELSI